MRVFCALALVSLLAACGGDDQNGGTSAADGDKPTLRFTAIPGEDPTLMKEKFQPVADHLSKELGVPVEYVHATKYAASVEMFKNGDVLLAWFGGLTGVQARDAVKGARAIVQGVEDPKYFSYFVANASTGLERSDDFPMEIAKMSFTFGSESSTSGRLMPEHFIRTMGGKAPKDFFETPPVYSGGHDKTCEDVENGTVQVGAVSYTTYDRRVRDFKAGKKQRVTDPSKCKVVWKTPYYADYNLTAHPDLDRIYGAGFTDKVQAAFVAMKGDLLGGFQRSALIPAKNEDFAAIEELAAQLGFIRQP